MSEDSLRVDRKLRRKVVAVFSAEIEERSKLVEQDDTEYQVKNHTSNRLFASCHSLGNALDDEVLMGRRQDKRASTMSA